MTLVRVNLKVSEKSQAVRSSSVGMTTFNGVFNLEISYKYTLHIIQIRRIKYYI